MRFLAIACCGLLLGACATGKPKTHTQVPSLEAAKGEVRRLRADLQDAKDGVRRARTLNERIDYKANLLE